MDINRYSQLQKIIQECLRNSRTNLGLSQQELSKRLGKPQSFVSKYESGERLLNFLELYQVCKALGMTLSEFVRQFEEKANGT